MTDKRKPNHSVEWEYVPHRTSNCINEQSRKVSLFHYRTANRVIENLIDLHYLSFVQFLELEHVKVVWQKWRSGSGLLKTIGIFTVYFTEHTAGGKTTRQANIVWEIQEVKPEGYSRNQINAYFENEHGEKVKKDFICRGDEKTQIHDIVNGITDCMLQLISSRYQALINQAAQEYELIRGIREKYKQ